MCGEHPHDSALYLLYDPVGTLMFLLSHMQMEASQQRFGHPNTSWNNHDVGRRRGAAERHAYHTVVLRLLGLN